MVLTQNRYAGQWNKMEDPNIGTQRSLALSMGLKTYTGEKKASLMLHCKCAEKTECPHKEEWNEPYAKFSHGKINPTWIRALHLKPEVLKLLEENIQGTLPDTDKRKGFLNRALSAQKLSPRSTNEAS